jgi:crotonobetainyl-CoA:carnitine CoA-transferase CaiB-like acyl-CoA transferase
MAEITRSGPLAGVRSLDFATAVTGVCASRTFGDLGADVIMLAPPMTRCVGLEDPQVHEQLIGAAEKIYGSNSYAELSEECDRCNSPR